MANILILTSYYLQQDHVLANNVTRIVSELRKSNDIVCISEELLAPKGYTDDNVKVIVAKASFLTRKYLLTKKKIYVWLNRIKSAILCWAYPNIDILLTNRKRRLAEKEFNQKDFDIVISFYRQYSNIQAMLDIKRKYPEVKICAVFLDLLEAYVPFGFSESRHNSLCDRIEKRLLEKCDCCFFPANIEREIMNGFADKWQDKIAIFDYPLYRYQERKSKTNNGKIKLLYAGSVDETYRNPMKLLGALNLLGNICHNLEVDFYVWGNCVHQIEDFSKETNYTLNLHALIKHDELMEKMNEADILINISNNSQKAVPSKIFEIASFGKPIINYSFNEDDFTNSYFEKYPCAFVLKEWKEEDNQKRSLAEFISAAREIEIKKEELDKLFEKNTAEYFVNLLTPLLIE